ncbi:2-dehydropantoate 2-reductase [Metabacillus sp. GX 13764]|uniref:2-dehydropantoate 2-reductase n=1 Tax=Metabacillus kandeliae TaxID=2900151 RepID=UPI001E3AA667|nr:2-dehydropantoate 2-reductase [Metabacillus kandeliae]MCD7033902.1 2-dehydropantoate 2-reductase [Metabacillus kandeliae]
MADKWMNSIGIIGGGAMGLLLAGYLSEDRKVTLYTRRKDQAELIQQNGISILSGGEEHIREIKASDGKQYEEDTLFITVKQFHLDPVIQNLKEREGKKLIFLQNGMGHIEKLQELSGHAVYPGTAGHGAQKLTDRAVRHNGQGVIKICSFAESSLEELQHLLPARSPLQFQFEQDWKHVLEEKLLVNACINPLTALFRTENGMLLDNPFFYEAFKTVYKEASAVLDSKFDIALAEEVCRNTAQNRSSMLQDAEKRNKTEIDAITGYLLKEARKKHLSVPLLEFLDTAVKGLTENDKHGIKHFL